MAVPTILHKPEPRWPALLALFSVGLLHFALPDHLNFGPPWLLLVVVSVLIVPTVVTYRTGRHKLNHMFGFATLGVVTAFLAVALVRLIWFMAQNIHDDALKHEMAGTLLTSALALWGTNVLVLPAGIGVWMPAVRTRGTNAARTPTRGARSCSRK